MTDTNEILDRLEPFVHGLGKAVLRELREALAQKVEPVVRTCKTCQHDDEATDTCGC